MMGLTILLSGCAITHDGDALSIPADVQTNAEARADYCANRAQFKNQMTILEALANGVAIPASAVGVPVGALLGVVGSSKVALKPATEAADTLCADEWAG
jgi:hypothetical protein